MLLAGDAESSPTQLLATGDAPPTPHARVCSRNSQQEGLIQGQRSKVTWEGVGMAARLEEAVRKGPCGWADDAEVPGVSQGCQGVPDSMGWWEGQEQRKGCLARTHFREPRSRGSRDPLTRPMTPAAASGQAVREEPEHLVLRGTKAPGTHGHLLPHLQEG